MFGCVTSSLYLPPLGLGYFTFPFLICLYYFLPFSSFPSYPSISPFLSFPLLFIPFLLFHFLLFNSISCHSLPLPSLSFLIFSLLKFSFPLSFPSLAFQPSIVSLLPLLPLLPFPLTVLQAGHHSLHASLPAFHAPFPVLDVNLREIHQREYHQPRFLPCSSLLLDGTETPRVCVCVLGFEPGHCIN